MADSPDPIALLRDLIRIDSVNPDLVPGAAGESGMAAWCGEWLTRHGFEVHWLEGRPGRPSVVGIRRGTGGGRSLLLNGHTDTVSVAGYDGDPFDPVERDGRLYGRGAFDMKSGLAAAMVAAARAASSPLAGDVMVACVADEEFGSIGTEEVVARFSADAAIVAEPTQLGVTVAHRGFAWFEVGAGHRYHRARHPTPRGHRGAANAPAGGSTSPAPGAQCGSGLDDSRR